MNKPTEKSMPKWRDLAGQLSSLMVLGCSLSAQAGNLNHDGQMALGNLLIDASYGEWSPAQAGYVVNWLDGVNPRYYGFNFDRSTYALWNPGIDQLMKDADQKSWDLSSLYGPQGTYNFAENGMTCGPNGPPTGTSADPSQDVSGCIGYVPGGGIRDAVDITTISNTFDRPTSQYQRDIRRFAANSLQQGMMGGGSASDNYAFDGRFGTYFSGGGSFGSLDGQLAPGPGAVNLNNPNNYSRVGFNNYNQTGTGAFDYRFTDWAVGGFLFNYTGTQTNMYLNAGQVMADSYRFMPFASFIPFDNAYIDVMAGYGYQTFNTVLSQSGSASYSADQALASIDLGYTLPFGAFELTGFAGGSYIGTDVSGFTLSQSGVTVQPYHVTSWTSTVGTQFAYAISSSVGVVQPILRVEWVHAYNTQGTVYIGNTNGAGGLQPVPSVLGISDWGNFTAGVQTTLPQGMMAFLNYQGQVMQGGQNNGVLGGLRLEF